MTRNGMLVTVDSRRAPVPAIGLLPVGIAAYERI